MAFATFFRGYKAEGAVGAYRICKPGALKMGCVLAAAPTDLLIGTSDALAKVTGEMVDVNADDIGEVVLGGTVAAGSALTSDATGAAVATTTAGHRVIGFAEVAGVAGDVITYQRSLGVF